MKLLYCARCDTPLMNAAYERRHGAYLPDLRGRVPSAWDALHLCRRSVRRVHQRVYEQSGGNRMNDDDRYFPCIPTPVGMVPFIDFTMSVEREKELFGKKVQADEHK